jgi:hypothetical protein
MRRFPDDLKLFPWGLSDIADLREQGTQAPPQLIDRLPDSIV